jgi:hypothetical protein
VWDSVFHLITPAQLGRPVGRILFDAQKDMDIARVWESVFDLISSAHWGGRQRFVRHALRLPGFSRAEASGRKPEQIGRSHGPGNSLFSG